MLFEVLADGVVVHTPDLCAGSMWSSHNRWRRKVHGSFVTICALWLATSSGCSQLGLAPATPCDPTQDKRRWKRMDVLLRSFFFQQKRHILKGNIDLRTIFSKRKVKCFHEDEEIFSVFFLEDQLRQWCIVMIRFISYTSGLIFVSVVVFGLAKMCAFRSSLKLNLITFCLHFLPLTGSADEIPWMFAWLASYRS